MQRLKILRRFKTRNPASCNDEDLGLHSLKSIAER